MRMNAFVIANLVFWMSVIALHVAGLALIACGVREQRCGVTAGARKQE